MKRLIALAVTAGVAVATAGVAVAPASAAEGCGRGFHRGPHGRCLPNGGRVVVAPGGALVVGRMYPGRGYWDGRRYWHNRRQWHGGWRYY